VGKIKSHMGVLDIHRKPRSRATTKGQGPYNLKRQIKINHVNGKTNEWSPWTPNVSTKSALSPQWGQASKKIFNAGLHTSGITPGIRTNTFEIYQSLRSSGSRKRVCLIWIQLNTSGTLSKEMLTPSSSHHWRSGRQCATDRVSLLNKNRIGREIK
jgi:hypothetical protein